MSACERIRADAPGIAALPPDDPERLAAEAHAVDCPECSRALREGAHLQALLAEVPHEPLPSAALEPAAATIREELRREGRRRMAWAAVAAGAAAMVLVALARHRSPSPLDRAAAVALWVAAVALAAIASRRPVAALVVAAGASVVAAALLGSAGPLAAGVGIECLATELASAAIVVGAAWLALRGGTTSPGRVAAAAAGAAGARAGDAALQLTCRVHASAPHLLVFHVGGLLVAAVAAGLLWRAPRQAEAA